FFQAEDGIRDPLVTGVQTVLFRSPPAGGGLMTETCAGPKKKNGGTSSEASTGAVSCVELTNVVGRSTPEKLTREPSIKFDPFTENGRASWRVRGVNRVVGSTSKRR